MRWEKSLSQREISSVFKLEGKPPLGNDLSFGQLNKCGVTRDGKRECIPSGSEFNFSQLEISISFKFGAQSPPLGKDSNLGQSKMCMQMRNVRTGWEPFEIENNSKFSHPYVSRIKSFGNNSNGKDQGESESPRITNFLIDGW